MKFIPVLMLELGVPRGPIYVYTNDGVVMWYPDGSVQTLQTSGGFAIGPGLIYYVNLALTDAVIG